MFSVVVNWTGFHIPFRPGGERPTVYTCINSAIIILLFPFHLWIYPRIPELSLLSISLRTTAPLSIWRSPEETRIAVDVSIMTHRGVNSWSARWRDRWPLHSEHCAAELCSFLSSFCLLPLDWRHFRGIRTILCKQRLLILCCSTTLVWSTTGNTLGLYPYYNWYTWNLYCNNLWYCTTSEFSRFCNSPLPLSVWVLWRSWSLSSRYVV